MSVELLSILTILLGIRLPFWRSFAVFVARWYHLEVRISLAIVLELRERPASFNGHRNGLIVLVVIKLLFSVEFSHSGLGARLLRHEQTFLFGMKSRDQRW